MKRFPLCALAAFIAATLGTACSRKSAGDSGGSSAAAQRAQVVEVAPITRGNLRESMSVVGSLEANESAQIRPEISGLVLAIYFEEGQAVKQGQLLMKIDDSELRAQYAQVEARYDLAERNVARSENLNESRTIPQSEYDRARSEFAAVRAELELLRLRIEKTAVKAPFDGVTGARLISPGDYVTSGSVLTTINDLSRLKMNFQVPERYLTKVRPGTPFRISSRSLDFGSPSAAREGSGSAAASRSASANAGTSRYSGSAAAGAAPTAGFLEGEVYFVSPIIDRGTRSSEIKGYLHEAPAALRPGMFANVEVTLEVRQGVLTVPEGAILTVSSGTQVIAVREDEDGEPVADFVPVRIGLRAQGLAEIEPLEPGALAEGQSVVAAGVGALVLYPGLRLTPQPLRAQFAPHVAE
ncbi:hypothetical protein AXK11_08485 [Cephaloticoccus primus]|uniref:Uncharacterized protein n=1 Tax=Cephaloticoccus primus TaxID=1548207 RepID=A0A139SIS7_9BACT|nr:efflux RND transporter periplasmic adaptor subunit [Cephaloticoccus primus]KXU34380.1 hypothetical protein AXK11_08485 [Cephaloticoccus primus]